MTDQEWQKAMEESGFFDSEDATLIDDMRAENVLDDDMDDSSDEDNDTDDRHAAEWESQTYEHYSGDHT